MVVFSPVDKQLNQANMSVLLLPSSNAFPSLGGFLWVCALTGGHPKQYTSCAQRHTIPENTASQTLQVSLVTIKLKSLARITTSSDDRGDQLSHR